MTGALIALGWLALIHVIDDRCKEGNSDRMAFAKGAMSVVSFGCIGWAAETVITAVIGAVL